MEIVEFLNLPKNTVCDIAMRCHDGLAPQGDPDEDKAAPPSRKKLQETSNKKRMSDFLQQLQKLIEENPMPPHFFGDEEKVNTEVYLNVLEDVVKPWEEEVTAGAG